jgi:hypothetical protein
MIRQVRGELILLTPEILAQLLGERRRWRAELVAVVARQNGGFGH